MSLELRVKHYTATQRRATGRLNSMNGSDKFAERRIRIYDYLQSEKIDAAVLEDSEAKRDTGIRYLTGHPGDALLFLFASGKSLLVPWDVHLARRLGHVDSIEPYTDHGRQPQKAIPEILAAEGIGTGGKCEIPSATPFPLVMELKEKLKGIQLVCRWDGIDGELRSLRICKDAAEIGLVRKAAEITNEVITGLENLLSDPSLSETDVALYIEREARKRGAEGLGFETIAAGPARSFGIHAFPPYSGEAFSLPGLSVLDFGIRFEGYTSDVTLTIARGTVTAAQRRKTDLVQEAYDLSVSLAKPGASTFAIARSIDDFFSGHGESMPHALGHGIGLEAHEAPFIRNREDSDSILAPGMVITLEPGLYHPETGGARLENDLLITENGAEILTRSRILTYP